MAVTLCSDAEATADRVLSALPRHEILHLSAHAHQEANDPFSSHFDMADGPLAVERLTQLDLTDARLALLLACDTARGDDAAPNEALHLVAALQAAGFPSVVGTTLPVDGRGCLTAARVLYEGLADGRPDLISRAPYLLHEAVERLRSDPATRTNPLAWVPLAHFGL
jgi:CHAT domain-containing protein